VRYESLLLPSGGERPELWCCRSSMTRLGQPEPGDTGEGGEQPGERQGGSALPDGPGRASRRHEGAGKNWCFLTLLKSPAGSDLVDLGWSATGTNILRVGNCVVG
jgi:hypothetical protein